jgi:MerR family transcriptional regulator, thiopeptide resistance regulator
MDNQRSYRFEDDPQQAAYQREAEERWGNGAAWRQSQERTKQWTRADYDRVRRDGQAFVRELAAAMDRDPASAEVQALVARHREGITTFYDCTDEIYAGLAELYVADPRFAAFYDRERPGLAAFLRRAMLISLGKAA